MAKRNLTVLLATAWLILGCDDPLALAALDSKARDIEAHLLDRLGYGPDPWTRGRIQELGIVGYIEEQLHPETIPDPDYQAMEALFPSLGLNYRQLHDTYEDERYRILDELSDARVLRAVHSRRQLEAVLIDFWFDHFNVYADSGLAEIDVTPYERGAIQPHVLGRFEDMLLAVARSPAMLDYLDNDENSVFGLNENFGRELLELHTVGVDGPYVEQDVVEVARVLTGWTTDYDASDSETGFRYRDNWHDDEAKQVMGLSIPAGGGEQDGRDLIHYLALHPATAAFLSRKLARRFVSEDPPQALVDRLAQVFEQTEGDLLAVMRTLLESPEFLLDSQNYGSKVKRPFTYLTSLARALEADGTQLAPRIRDDLEDLGEEPYLARPPTGYPEDSSYWSGNGALLGRFEIAYWTALGEHDLEFVLDETGTPGELAEALIPRVFLRAVSQNTRSSAIAYLESLPAGDRNAGQMLGMLLSSPEFLSH